MRASERAFARANRSLAVVLSLALAAPVLGVSVASRAAEPSAAELAAAREIFARGVQLEEAHQWFEALAQFRKVAAVKVTAAVRFHLGLCLENTGKLVDALNEFNRAEAAATPGEPDAAIIVEKSKKHVAELGARIPRVVVVAPVDVQGVEVLLDAAPVAASLFGTGIPVDPGTHVVHAGAPRRLAFERSFQADERTSTTIEIVLPEDPNAPPDPGPAPTTTTKTGGPGAWPWIVGGFGVVALVGAGVMFADRASALNDLESACPSHSDCPGDKQSTYDRGRRDALLGDVFLGVGIAAVATSIVLFTLGGEKKEGATMALGLSPFGARLSGSF
jgi:hypothetical protein